MKNIFVTSDKTYCLQHHNSTNFTQLQHIISNKTNIPVNSLIIRHNGHILYDMPQFNNNDILMVTHRIKGGKRERRSRRDRRKKNKGKDEDRKNDLRDIIKEEFGGGGIGDAIKSALSIFDPVVDFFVFIFKVIEWIFLFLIWFITDIINPAVWINDVLEGGFVGLQLLGAGLMDACISVIREIFNRIFNPLIKGIWGDEWDAKTDSKCYAMPACTVPYPILLATIILPPLGVFMELGVKGWLNILICALLTLFFYVPGLIYALILLYC